MAGKTAGESTEQGTEAQQFSARELASDSDPKYRPFRSWALQQDLVSLLGGGSDWRAQSHDFGLEDQDQRDATSMRGQSYLREAMEPNPRLELRTRVSIALWVVALITDGLNQWGPTGLPMPGDSIWVVYASVIPILIFTLAFYPRFNARNFQIAEQTMLAAAYAIIAYQCSETGGAESPYMVWLLFAAFYAAYLLPRRRALVNLFVISGVTVAAMFLTNDPVTTNTLIFLTTNLLVTWLIGFTLLRQHRFEDNLERAVCYLELADPLTGVANLRAFEQFVDKLSRTDGQRFAVVMADMNGLKGANTVFGHDVGDGMVLRMSRLMRQASDPTAQVARIGGDEFAAVLPDAGQEQVNAWRARFDHLVAEHNTRVRGRLPQISMAVGAANYPQDGLTAADLLNKADARMYEQKTPAVTPPYELADPTGGVGGLLREARFADAPRRTVEARDRYNHATNNWLIVGLLSMSTILLPAHDVPDWAGLLVGFYGFAMAASCQWALRGGPERTIRVVVDLSTMVYALPAMIVTGGSSSPIQLAMALPVAFYAQYLLGRQGWGRVAACIVFYTIGFWAPGDVTPAEESLYATVVTAMIVISTILQANGNSLRRSLAIVRDSATHDPLTKILNLHAFRDDLAEAIRVATGPDARPHARPALLIADLDEFRKVNTRTGHSGGDQILCSAVDHLREEFGSEAAFYRVGGDEFAVLFTADRALEASVMADRCRRALEFRSPTPEPDGMKITASVGFAVWQRPLTPELLVESVESALAESKTRRGRTVPAGTNVML